MSMGFPRQEHWSGLPFSPPEDLPNPGIEPGSPALQADSLPTELSRKPINLCFIESLYVPSIIKEALHIPFHLSVTSIF